MKKVPFHKLAIIVFLGLALLTVAKFLYQDAPHMRATGLAHNDMQPLYLSSRVWVAGGNPYDPSTLAAEMRRSVPGALEILHGDCGLYCQNYYPPTALPIFAATSFLPWKIHFYLYVAALVFVYLFCLYSLAEMLENSSLKLIFWGFGLAFSPFHAGISSYNVSMMLIPLLLLCVLRYDTVASAIVISLVACIKPPLGMLFVGYYVLSGQKKKAFASVGIIALVAAISLFHLRGVDWLASYKLAISHFSPTTDGAGGVAEHGVANTGFLNMQVLFYILFRNARLAVLLNNFFLLSLYVALLFASFRSAKDRHVSENHMATMAALCALTLFLPSLQYYNGLLLLAPLLYSLRLRPDGTRLFVGLACATFALPPRWFVIFDMYKRMGAGVMLNSDLAMVHVNLTFGQELAAAVASILTVAIAFVLVFTVLRWRSDSKIAA